MWQISDMHFVTRHQGAACEWLHTTLPALPGPVGTLSPVGEEARHEQLCRRQTDARTMPAHSYFWNYAIARLWGSVYSSVSLKFLLSHLLEQKHGSRRNTWCWSFSLSELPFWQLRPTHKGYPKSLQSFISEVLQAFSSNDREAKEQVLKDRSQFLILNSFSNRGSLVRFDSWLCGTGSCSHRDPKACRWGKGGRHRQGT
jgi:hypothetical protein